MSVKVDLAGLPKSAPTSLVQTSDNHQLVLKVFLLLSILLFPSRLPASTTELRFAISDSFLVGETLEAMHVIDVNGDLLLDVVGFSNDYTVRVFLGDGTGSFSPPSSFSTTAEVCKTSPVIEAGIPSARTRLAVSDVDGDGDLDLIAGNSFACPGSLYWGTLAVLRNDGTGSYSAPEEYRIDLEAYDIRVGFLDGDALPDIVLSEVSGYWYTARVSIRLNAGDGTFPTSTIYVTDTEPSPFTTTLGDFDADGFTDLAVSNEKKAQWLPNLGNGTFGIPTNLSIAGITIGSGQFNSDSLADIVLGTSTDSYLLLNGTSGFSAPARYSAFSSTLPIVVADLNGDSLDDAVLSTKESATTLLQAASGGFLQPRGYGIQGSIARVEAVDFSGNGYLDLVAENADPGRLGFCVIENVGGGILQSRIDYPEDTNDYAWHDWNSDGIVDLFLLRWMDTVLYLGDGNGSYNQAVTIQQAYAIDEHNRAFAIGDFDFDANPDLAISRNWMAKGRVSVIRNITSQGASTTDDYNIGTSPNWIVEGDIDNDGDLDLLSDGWDQFALLLTNAGDGTFSGPTYVPTGSPPKRAVLADLDGNSFLDIVTVSSSDAAVLINNGDGSFQAPQFLGLPGVDVLTGSFDLDEAIDLAILNYFSLSILKNRGDGSFNPPATYALSSTSVAFAGAHDFSGDGIDDLVFATTDNEVLLWSPPATDSLAGSTRLVAGGPVKKGVVGQFAGDDRMDISVLTNTHVSIFEDRTPVIVSVTDGTPAHARLLANYPNPFNPQTVIPMLLSERGSVTLRIYDVRGRLIKTLWSGPAPQGLTLVPWDGTGEAGRPASSGVYSARLNFGVGTHNRRLVLVK